MDRVKIKKEAKEFINGKKWIIWQALLVIAVPGIVETILGNLLGEGILTDLIGIVCSFATTLLTFGAYEYLLHLVRGEKYDVNDTFKYLKDTSKWQVIILTSLVVGLCIVVGSCLLVVPGIIMACSLAFYVELTIDADYKLGLRELLHKSREFMNGHKMDYFIFCLSFIGWFFLCGLTFGILLIWVAPYVTIASIKYYEELRKLKK